MITSQPLDHYICGCRVVLKKASNRDSPFGIPTSPSTHSYPSNHHGVAPHSSPTSLPPHSAADLQGSSLEKLVAEAAAGAKPRLYYIDYWDMSAFWGEAEGNTGDNHMVQHAARAVLYLQTWVGWLGGKRSGEIHCQLLHSSYCLTVPQCQKGMCPLAIRTLHLCCLHVNRSSIPNPTHVSRCFSGAVCTSKYNPIKNFPCARVHSPSFTRTCPETRNICTHSRPYQRPGLLSPALFVWET